MSQVAATMGTTTDAIQDLRDFALEMGSTTAFSASQAAEALNFMALAGYDAKTAMSMLPNVLSLAAAGGMGLATASDMITDAQSALGLTLEQTTNMVDQMARAASRSNTSVAQLGEAILTVGGTAQYMYGGTEELSAVLGILADNGIKGSEAGTHLRNMLLSLSSPTKNAQAQLQALGVEIFDAEGNMRSFSDIFPELNASMATLTDQQKLDAFSAIFNSRDIAAATALLTTTTERWYELGDAILDSAGAAQQMAETQLDNLAGDVVKFKSALEGAQIVLSDQLTPNLREFVQFGTSAISTLSEAFKEGGLSGAMEALGIILSNGLNMVVESAPKMVKAGMDLLGALGKGLLDNLPVITDAAVEIVLMLAGGLIQALPELANGAVQIISELGSGIGKAAPDLIPAAVEAVMKFLEGLTTPESLNNLINGALSLIKGLGDGIIRSIPILVEYAPNIVANLAYGIISALPQMLEVGGQLLMGLLEGLGQAIVAIPATIGKVVNAVIGGFKSAFGIHSPSTVFADMGGMLVQGLLNGISNAWSGLKNFVGGLVDGLVGGVKSLLGIHSPSTVFAGIGGNMALGLEKGWEDEYADIRREIENGLSFSAGNIGVTATGTYNTAGTAQSAAKTGFCGAGNTYVTINSPVAVDAVQAAREWKKTTQRMAMNYA